MNLKLEYRNLESKVHASLRDKIFKSTYISKTHDLQALPVKFSDNWNTWECLAIINDRLTLIDEDGQHQDAVNVNLEFLIDLLQNEEE